MANPKQSDPFSDFVGEFADRLGGDRWRPDVDVFETDKEIVVRAEMAGVRSEDLRVSVDGTVLRISGVRRPPEGPDVERLHQVEIASGPFERRIRLAVSFERGRVTAHLSDGFLTVSLPKRAPQSVPVER